MTILVSQIQKKMLEKGLGSSSLKAKSPFSIRDLWRRVFYSFTKVLLDIKDSRESASYRLFLAAMKNQNRWLSESYLSFVTDNYNYNSPTIFFYTFSMRNFISTSLVANHLNISTQKWLRENRLRLSGLCFLCLFINVLR